VNAYKYSPAREKTHDVIALYQDGNGHKAIAKKLNISPRIALVMLKESGIYEPGRLRGAQIAEAARKRELARIAKEQRRAILRSKAEHRAIKKQNAKPMRRYLSREHARIANLERLRERYHSDTEFRILSGMRQVVRNAIRKQGARKDGRTHELIGLSKDEFKLHIESQFKKGMHWGNWGQGVGKWHVDHIVPCTAFDLSKPEEQRRCFHYSNLRPMWGSDNIRKGGFHRACGSVRSQQVQPMLGI
jgi:hypothetical protein